VPFTAAQIWDRVYPRIDSPRADLTAWTPQVVFVNYGENDDSFTQRNNQAFPAAEFTDRYVMLVQAMRHAYPAATIVILRGGMYGGAKSERLRAPWYAAVGRLEEHDAHVTHYVFEHWSPTHPRVADDRAMADELIAWLRKQPFMAGMRAEK
jgi:lysophospholipase L1-like esterase